MEKVFYKLNTMHDYWYKKNKTQLLRGFCAVMEEGGVLKASKKLNISQSSVSLQISSLERDLDFLLFRRENQKLIPTKEADKFYKLCKKFITEMDFMFKNAKAMVMHDVDDKISIAAHTYMLSHILPPYFKQMIAKNPNVRFELHNTSFEETIELLNSGTVDFAVFPAAKENLPKNIVFKEFYKCKFGFGSSKDHPLADIPAKDINWDVVAKYDFITMGQKMTAQGLKAIVKTSGINSRFELHNGTWEICLGIVKQGISISFSDIKYVEGNKDVVIKECPHLMPEYHFNILTNKAFNFSKASKQFMKLLQGKS